MILERDFLNYHLKIKFNLYTYTKVIKLKVILEEIMMMKTKTIAMVFVVILS